VAFVEEAFFPEGGHDPPDGLHVIGVHGFVVPVKVHPAAQAGDGLAPLFDVALYRGAAGFVETGDAVIFDVGFGVKAQFFFDEVFYGEAVAVPAEAALDVFAPHGLVAGDDVFDGAGYEVPEVGESGGEGGAVVKDIFFPAFPPGHGLFEGMAPFPKGEDLFFQFGEVYLWVHRFIHRPLLLGYVLVLGVSRKIS
jgi:hypothetical protein